MRVYIYVYIYIYIMQYTYIDTHNMYTRIMCRYMCLYIYVYICIPFLFVCTYNRICSCRLYGPVLEKVSEQILASRQRAAGCPPLLWVSMAVDVEQVQKRV